MHVDEIEQSLRDLAAAQPPVGPGRPAVRRRHRTVRAAQVGAAVVTVVALVVGVAVWRSSDTASSGLHVVTGPTDTLPVDPALARCFPTLAPRSEDKAAPIVDGSTQDWPSPRGRPARAHRQRGAVGDPRRAPSPTGARATSGHGGARTAPIYASRLEGSAVVIDRLTGPGQATPAVQLPFTMKAGAPAGYCAMDGYQADFSIGPEGDGAVAATRRSGRAQLPGIAPDLGVGGHDRGPVALRQS